MFNLSNGRSTPKAWACRIAGTLGLICTMSAHAQDVKPAVAQSTGESGTFLRSPMMDTNVKPAGCATCGGDWVGPAPADCFKGCENGCPTGSCNGHCYPGQAPCGYTNPETFIGRFCNELKCCFCCSDHCYEPRWIAAANSAFFTDDPRPVSQTRIRWEKGHNLVLPDRNEFFWARTKDGKGPKNIEDRVDYDSLSFIAEAGTEMFSVVVNAPYLSIEPLNNPHHAGFADMDIATKSVLFDREIFQLTFQFRTFIPLGVPGTGTGKGHVALEPSFLFGLHLAENTYMQGQLSEWIPIGGDDTFQGSIVHFHLSMNRLLWRPFQDVQLIGNIESVAYHFQDGAYYDGFGVVQNSAGQNYVTAGPGLRLVVCDRFDIGTGAQFALSDDHFAQTTIRTEIRLRF